MRRLLTRLLTLCGIHPGQYLALSRALLTMDLRGQHFAKATATRPKHIMSPLFLVVGQCLTLSAAASLVLFMRVDVFAYALAGLATSMLVMFTTVLVEFHEVVLDPQDLEILGHRPISPRTYAAARLTNLLFYVALMYIALNLFPLILGAALRDSGPWYVPAYLAASLAGSLLVVCITVLLLSYLGGSPELEAAKETLAWTQIVLILVVGYGAQLLFRDKNHALEMFSAFPPPWVDWLPPGWLARLVEQATYEPGFPVLRRMLLWIALTVVGCAATWWRVSRLYRQMQPVRNIARVHRRPLHQIGTLSQGITAWLARSAGQRVGFWLCSKALARDGDVRIRCLLPLNTGLAIVVLGLCTAQFDNPLVHRDPGQILLPILALYSIPLAIPVLIHNLSYSSDSDAAWVLSTAGMPRPLDLGLGMCRAVQWFIVTPLCLALGGTMWLAWGDPVSALLHASLAWGICWPVALASLSFVSADLPLAMAYSRGSSLGPISLPLAGFFCVLSVLTAIHVFAAGSVWFWLATAAAALASCWPLGRLAEARWIRLAEAQT